MVWNHFTIINRQNTRWEVENLAECKYCKKTYSCGDTGHLKRHAEQCNKKHGALDPRQSQISQNEIGSSTSSMTPFIYNQQFLREGLARMVASMGLPLTFGEDPRFVHFMHKYAQPTYHRIPRNDVIKCYLNEKQLIIEEFKNHSGIQGWKYR